MRKSVYRRPGGKEVVSRLKAVGMIFAILALVLTTVSFAPTASAEPGETLTTTAPAAPAEDPPAAADDSVVPPAPTTQAPPTQSPTGTTEAPEPPTEAPSATTEAPAPSTTDPAPTTESSAPTSSTPKRQARAGGANPGIKVDVTKIEVEGKPGQQATVGDSVLVAGTWDASDADPQPGDTFTVGFPKQLNLIGNSTFNLVGDDGTVWGTCTVSSATNVMNCKLSDAVTDRPEEVKGKFEVYAKATERTTSETVDFNLNGKTTAVDLPATGGITDGQQLGKAKKSGKLTSDKQAVRWTIDIPGSDLLALESPRGSGHVTLTDELGKEMELCAEPRLDAKLSAGRPNSLKPVSGGVTVTQPGGAGTPVSIGITNGDQAIKADQLYRIEYTTCSTSGVVDPAGTEYTNAVTIGDDEVGAVVGQDWKPQSNPSKSGSLTNRDRFRTIDWTILVPGTDIKANGFGISLKETLEGPHAVCSAGLGLKIAKADYLPGADGKNPARTDVTGQFDITSAGDTAGSKSFTSTMKVKDTASFDEKQYYYLTYQTCVTTDKMPDTTDVFVNKATVNGKDLTASVKGPPYNGRKNGALNNESKDVAGQTQPAGTTVDWTVTVPGHHLEGLTAPAVISDTFSDTLTVCEVTGDLRKDLNLKVTAKDIIGDESQNATRDLTATTGVTRTANGIDLTLPKDAGDYSRETVYTIEYTLCTSSGGLDQRGTVYSNSIDYADKKFSSKVTQEWGGGGTGEGASRGSFSLTKTIDRASVDVPEDTQFTVKVEEFAPGTFPKGPAASTYNIKVKADGTPVNGLNPRGNGWQIRLTEIDLPKVDGAYFEPGKFLPAPGVVLNAERTQALVSITPKSNVEVALVNKAAHGSAKVTKTVTGEAKDAGALTGMENFVFNAEIEYGDKDAGNELRTFTLKDGQFYNLKDLPIGAKVTITEVQPVDTDRVSWSTPVVSKNPLVIGTDAAANAVSVTNEAKLTRGTFSLSKKLTGPESSNKNVPTGFEVLATWTDAAGKKQSKTLTLPADGTSVPFGQNLPGGTQVTLTEKVPANGNGLAWGVPAFSGDVTVGADDSGVVTIGKEPGKVTVTNFVDKNDGTLQIVKQVTGEAADKVGDGVEFKVLARWKDGADYRSKELTVKQGVSTPLGVDLPIGTEVTFSEIDRPQVEGVEWGQISWGTEPSGASWLTVGADGTATGIVSDDPKEGRLITLSNEALWQFGSVEFTKFVLDGDDPVPAGEAGLPKDTEFEVRIEGVDPALPKGTVFPAVGETITLNAANNWTFTSGDVLPRGTVVTFSEVDPDPLPGKDWARPYYFVTKDGGDEGYRNTVQIVPGQKAVVQIHNRPTPTAEVDIEKVVTGPKGRQVTKDPSALFQVTATWTDSDGEARSCVLNVKPGASATPTAKCEAAVVDGRPQFPLDTEITFTETGARTGVSNVKWGDVVWSVKSGSATMVQSDSEPNGVVVTLTGEANKKVELKLENKTSRDGLIILPLPIPLPGWPGGPGWPGWPGGPNGPGVNPGPNKPVGPNGPGSNGPGSNGPGSNGPGSNGPDSNGPGSDGPGSNGRTGHNGAPGQPAPQQPDQSQSLPVTGANVIWLGLGALVLIAGGGWLVLRNRRRAGSDG